MTNKDLTKELYFDTNRETTIDELKELVEYMLGLTWKIDIYRNKPAQRINLADLGWTFKFGKTKRAAGRCVRKGVKRNFFGDIESVDKKYIELSMHYIDQNLEESKEWEEVIRHEIAHALDVEIRGKSNHDRHWKAIAQSILSTGARTFTKEQLKDEKTSKYTLICDNCGETQPSHRKKKRKSACVDCCNEYNGGRYTEKFALRQVQNY